ncbi:hypothetical protein ScPMuIL_001927 [Solemya velum]
MLKLPNDFYEVIHREEQQQRFQPSPLHLPNNTFQHLTYESTVCRAMSCNSIGKNYRSCQVEGAGQIESVDVLEDQSPILSSCKHLVSFGIDGTSIWVTNGCRAKFEVCFESVCPRGLYGHNCNVKCSEGCKNGECLNPYGECRYGCKAGWGGILCHEECPTGMYGEGCKNICNRNCKDEQCNDATGVCTLGCIEGWLGDMCNIVCPNGTYGDSCENVCNKNCEAGQCNKVNGICTLGCVQGWLGDMCDIECPTGTYGVGCEHLCNEHCVAGDCDKKNGDCRQGCHDGWLGDRCDVECPIGTYGIGCKHLCNEHCVAGDCDKRNGDCRQGCRDGWLGDRCDVECPIGTYGMGCEHLCNEHCVAGDCDKKNGDCRQGCHDGWLGDRCDVECPNGTYGVGCEHLCDEHCVAGDCDRKNGDCRQGCHDGWLGDRCDVECPIGTHGVGCEHLCNEHCVAGDCDKKNGDCRQGCHDGWLGDRCDVAHPKGRIRPDCLNCKNQLCHNKVCLLGCEDGFMGIQCQLTTEVDEVDGSSENSSNDLICIIAASVGVLIGIVGVTVGVFILLKRRRISQPLPVMPRLESRIKMPHYDNPANNSSDGTEMKMIYERTPSTGNLIEQARMSIHERALGVGCFGEVKRGTLKMRTGKTVQVVIKIMNTRSEMPDLDAFQEEIDVFNRVGKHPNIVHFYGLYKVAEANSFGIVMEFFAKGDLRSYLHLMKPEDDIDKGTLYQFLHFGIDIARGMNYLLKKQIIHRDLAARNVLLDSNLNAKISDFGLSRNETLYIQSNLNARIPYKWMAIEVLRNSSYTTASDV